MGENNLNIRIKHKYDTETNWTKNDPVLLSGEVAYSSDKSGKYKLGDGIHKWSELSYAKADLVKSDVTTALGYTPPTSNTWRGIQDNLISDSADDSLSAAQGKALKTLVDEKLSLAGGTMNGPIKWNGTNALPQFTDTPSYLVGIDAFPDGGTMKWTTASNVKVGKASNADEVPWSGITDKPSTYTPSSHTHDDSTITSLDASKLFGTIDIERLPQGSLERCIIVEDDEARFALTTENIQLGDTVKVKNSEKMYFVIDESKLDSEEGYTVYAAGTAASVPWSGITGKPTSYPPSEHMHNEYLNDLTISGKTITYTRGDGTTGEIVTQDTWRGIQDNLDSESPVDSLSAAQGKILNEKKLGTVNANGYFGITKPDGTSNDWIRTTSLGIIPYQSGESGNGHSSLGNESWYFSSAYIDNIYGNLRGNASSANKLVTARKIGSASFDGSADITLTQMGIVNPIELTRAEYNNLIKNDLIDDDQYYNVIDDYDSDLLINDTITSDKFVYSSDMTEKTYSKKSISYNETLNASNWSGSSSPYSYTLSLTGVTDTNIVEINYASSASDTAIEAYQGAGLKDGGQTTDQITLLATEKPTVDIPITAVIRNDL